MTVTVQSVRLNAYLGGERMKRKFINNRPVQSREMQYAGIGDAPGRAAVYHRGSEGVAVVK